MKKIKNKSFGQNLRQRRIFANLTQEKLAKKIGISRQSLNAIETGRSVPSLKLAQKISDFFSTNINNLIKRKEETMAEKRDWFSWSPFDELAALHSSIDRLFEESFPQKAGLGLAQPKVDMYEKDDNLIVEAEMPGVEEKDINIELTEEAIKIEGEKKGEVEMKTQNYYQKELRSGSFSRTISFPFPVEADKAKATFKNGKLKVVIPKSAKMKKRVIKIKPE